MKISINGQDMGIICILYDKKMCFLEQVKFELQKCKTFGLIDANDGCAFVHIALH